jgi:hypothetical protein
MHPGSTLDCAALFAPAVHPQTGKANRRSTVDLQVDLKAVAASSRRGSHVSKLEGLWVSSMITAKEKPIPVR